jgi:KDO2-lipid IV(A) lauroyltransferase
MKALSWLFLSLLWLLHWLPLGVQASLGRALGRVLFALARRRRRIALRNVELCLPELSAAAREALVREHFQWLARGLLERSLQWWASAERLKRIIHVEGDVHLAERSERPIMWLAPHFVGVDAAAISTQLYQTRRVASIYSAQSNPVYDAALRQGRMRFGLADIFSRHQSALPLVRAIKRGCAFYNAPDMDFGLRDAAFVPYLGHQAATLLAPSKMARALNMIVQPVVAEILPGGQGYVVRYLEPWTDWPTDDPVADAARTNRWLEEQIRRCPAQYLWVHKRFKTRPPGEPSVYG